MILALETAAESGGVALVEDDPAGGACLLGERVLDTGQRHASSLLVAVDELLASSGRKLEQVELVAVSIGPGSFTGLRIGLATALGLCFGTARRIVPVPTLAALSLRATEATLVAPWLDARKGQVYAGLYGPGGSPLQGDQVSRPEPWLERLPAGEICLLGSGAVKYRDAIEKALGPRARFLPAADGAPSAASVGLLGARLAREGAARDPREVEPRYLRPPDAEFARR